MLSYAACAGCVIMSIPPIMIGAIARATDWNQTTWSQNGSLLTPEDCGQNSKILPLVLQHLTPPVIVYNLESIIYVYCFKTIKKEFQQLDWEQFQQL